MSSAKTTLLVCLLTFPFVCVRISSAQDAPAASKTETAPPAAPAPLTTPAITGPLQQQPPLIFDAGFFGKIAVDGVVSSTGLWQSNHVPGDNPTQAALSNGQIFIQKTDGWFQFYIQAGAYTLPSLATPFLGNGETLSNFYGAVPQGYIKLQAGKNTAFEIGALPTLIGAESTFTFQNMNIERGLLWNQENAVNRGVQINQTLGKFTASVTWNDGFYSNRYTWIWGSLAYTNGPHTLSFVGGGNLGQTKFQTLATPVQNNGSIYNIIYTYSKQGWIIQPYVQYGSVPTNATIGVTKGASTTGGAILVSRSFKHGASLAGRYEYIASSGSAAQQSVNLLFGPGSSGTSFTLTPTYQSGGFFVRGDLSWVHAINSTPGATFGSNGANVNQPRAMAEIGFIFGNNISGK